jgi:microcystin-dependent protein
MKSAFFLSAALGALLGVSAPAAANQTGDYTGEVLIFAGTFCPHGYARMDGQTLSIAQESQLFSLIGTQFGADGISNFQLPDLRGRISVGDGTGPGLTARAIGDKFGVEEVALTEAHIPAHTHPVYASTGAPDRTDPAGNAISTPASGPAPYTTGGGAAFAAPTVSSFGGDLFSGQADPVTTRMPIYALTFCIATQGLYPPRN